MSETTGNNFVAIGASNRLSIDDVKLLQRAVDNEMRRIGTMYTDESMRDVARLDKMGNDLMVIASKIEAGL